MAEEKRSFTLGALAELVGGELGGPADLPVTRPVPADSNEPGGITFAENEKFLATALAGEAGAIIVPAETGPVAKPVIRHAIPRMAFGMVLTAFTNPMPKPGGIDPTAQIHPSAQIHETASVGPYAIVQEGAQIAAGANIMAHAYIGQDCTVGENTEIFPHVVLVQNIQIGSNCRIHAGAVLGSDGFGFFWNGQYQQKVPHVGGVIVGNHVEIGANTCIDRATCGDTIIGDGVKFDNMVQIAHNVKIGRHSVIASQVGISGSSVVGERNAFGGQVGVTDHVVLGDNMSFGGKTGVIGSMDTPGEYFGTPAVPVSTAMRVLALQTRLPELFKRMRELERQLEELKNGKNV